MTGGRAERRGWKENGAAWTTWRQDVSRVYSVQRTRTRDGVLKRSLRRRGRPSALGGEGVVVVVGLFSPQSCDLQAFDNGRWECLDIRRGPQRARTRRAKFSHVTASAAAFCLCTVSFGE